MPYLYTWNILCFKWFLRGLESLIKCVIFFIWVLSNFSFKCEVDFWCSILSHQRVKYFRCTVQCNLLFETFSKIPLHVNGHPFLIVIVEMQHLKCWPPNHVSNLTSECLLQSYLNWVWPTVFLKVSKIDNLFYNLPSIIILQFILKLYYVSVNGVSHL